jgi:hypothetical protein
VPDVAILAHGQIGLSTVKNADSGGGGFGGGRGMFGERGEGRVVAPASHCVLPFLQDLLLNSAMI